MKFKTLLVLCCCFVYNIAFTQKDDRIADAKLPLDEVEQYRLPYQNNETLMQAELLRRAPGVAPRYAENVSVNITPDTHGSREILPNGDHLWRLRIYSKDAKSLNLGFTKFFMPEGASLILYTPDFKEVRGPFTPADNEEHEQLWTPLLFGEEIVVEVRVPASKRAHLTLQLSYVNHDFMGFNNAENIVLSGSCNVDVICGAADGWAVVDGYRDIIRSVAVISTGGGTFCTGFLVNNVRQDCKPYFMTADHCGINAGNAASLVTYWNFQNSFCRQPGSAESGQAGDGQLNDFNTGSTFRAASSATDFVLVELDDPVSPTANAFLAGWNAELTLPTGGAIAVHHPSTDEKRISFENDQDVYWGNWGSGGQSIPDGNHVIIPDWNIGTTEPGSSGSPVFDINKRVIGQLHGGGAACGNNDYDSYGGMAFSWTGGGTPSTRLSDWLDPDGTGILVIDGSNVPCFPHCSNGEQDEDETGVDCGGADCIACPTCDDGIQNQGETAVDCGGPCPAVCPTCDDGILNQGETEVDCGGPNCPDCPCRTNALTLQILLDNYPEETTWTVIDDQFNEILTSNGTYANYADGATAVEEICLEDGCYNFILNDAYGDGICCGYGIGRYELLLGTDTLAFGAEFAFADTTAFCIESPVSCPPFADLSDDIISNTYSVGDYITSNGRIPNSNNVTFQAGNYIDLTGEFEVELGAEFLAEIVVCFTGDNPTEERQQISIAGKTEAAAIVQKQIRYEENPFSAISQATFKLNQAGTANLSVQDLSGNIVKPVFNDKYFDAGKHSISFSRKGLVPGVYHLILEKPGGTFVREAFVVTQ